MPFSSAFDEVTLAVNLCVCYFQNYEMVNIPLDIWSRINLSTKSNFVDCLCLQWYIDGSFIPETFSPWLSKNNVSMFKVTYFFTKGGVQLKSQSLVRMNLGTGCPLRRIHCGSLWETVILRYYLSKEMWDLDVVINHTVVSQHKHHSQPILLQNVMYSKVKKVWNETK